MSYFGGFWQGLITSCGKHGMDMMAFRETEGCHARVDKHMSWNGKCCGLELFCCHFLVSFVRVWGRAFGIRNPLP